jgi:hypothetical protein
VAKQKRQHVIPNCYLKAWCDPRTPTGQSPYIWRISSDGSKKKKKSPEKSFTANDRYTIKMPDGGRNLAVENTLGGIENDFVRALTRIRRRENLNAVDRARLCLFTAAMHTRSVAMGEHWRKQQENLHKIVADLEERRNVPPKASLGTAKMVEHAHLHLIGMGIETEAPLLFQMQMSIIVTDDEVGFITSDTPCVWFNPELYKVPPLRRSPGLGQAAIEVTLPLTPHHLLVISHRQMPLYFPMSQQAVDEFNRRTRFYCAEEFVSWKGETRPFWFDCGTEPEDSWEKSRKRKDG